MLCSDQYKTLLLTYTKGQIDIQIQKGYSTPFLASVNTLECMESKLKSLLAKVHVKILQKKWPLCRIYASFRSSSQNSANENSELPKFQYCLGDKRRM